MSTTDTLIAEATASYTGPVQLFDLDRMERTLRSLSHGLGDPGRVLMAVKAFPARPVLELAHALGAGFEVSSTLEYDLLPEALDHATVALNAPVADHLERYRTHGNRLHAHLDSADQEVALRVPERTVLGVRVSHTGLVPGPLGDVPGMPSRFGIGITQLRELAPLFRSGRLRGVHVHNGSEMNTPAWYLAALDVLLEVARDIGRPFDFIDLGGGFHPIHDQLIEPLLAELTRRARPTVVLIEPGRMLCRGAGLLLTKVIAVREMAPDEWKVTVDASYQCHGRWATLEWRAAPAMCAMRLRHDHAGSVPAGHRIVSFVGPTCIELDHLAVYALPGHGRIPLAVDDLVAFDGIDGYTYAWNTAFNGVPPAQVRFFRSGTLEG